MRTENEWQLREKELLESNNQLLTRARKAERALVAAHAKEPELFWNCDDPEIGHISLEDLLDYADVLWIPIQVDTGYRGPTTFAALVWDPDGEGTQLVEAPTRFECNQLVEAARVAYVAKQKGEA